MTYLLQRFDAVHISVSRLNLLDKLKRKRQKTNSNETTSAASTKKKDCGMYKHHAVVVAESQTKFSIYHSASAVKAVSKFKHTHVQDIEEICLELGIRDISSEVYLCLYPHMNSKEFVKERVGDILHQVKYPYYSTSSLNCENVATYLMTGVGQSFQLRNIGMRKRVLCDLVDNITFYKDISYISFAFAFFGVIGSLFLEGLLVNKLYKRERRLLKAGMKETRLSVRLQFKYIASISVAAFFSISVTGMMTMIIILPPCFGIVFDMICSLYLRFLNMFVKALCCFAVLWIFWC